MNSKNRHYLFGALFICFGGYQAYNGELLECSLYSIAGLAFIANSLTFEPKLLRYKKTLIFATWALIIFAGVLFLYLLQFKL
jgi:hypothetical protein